MDTVKKQEKSDLEQDIKTENIQYIKTDASTAVGDFRPDFMEMEDEIDLYKLFQVIWGRKYIIAVAVVAELMLAFLFIYMSNVSENITELAFVLNFPGIEKYQTPDGLQFEKFQIITPNLLSKVETIKEKDKQIHLRDMIYISTIDTDKNQLNPKELDKRNIGVNYFPNRFLLSFVTDDASILTDSEKSTVLLSIIENYKTDFQLKYVKRNLPFGTFDENVLEKIDYLDIINIIGTKISKINSFLEPKIETSGLFRSTRNNQSFFDLKSDFGLLKKVHLSKAKAIIDNMNLTKNPDVYILQLKERIKKLGFKKEKAKGRELLAQELLKEINADGSRRSEFSINTGRQKLYSDSKLDPLLIEKLIKNQNSSYLIKIIMESGSKAREIEIDKKKTKLILDELENKMKSGSGTINVKKKHVESLLIAILAKYNSLHNELVVVNNEFLEIKFSNSIKITNFPESFVRNSHLSLKVLAITVVISLFLAVFGVLFCEFIKNNRRISEETTTQERT